ncbi:hypothetical protein B9G98_02780 [Wickerhamiella sorbophila]|uniref:Protein LOT5 n=1 Tax=Wickerhamiella sorbophila TaxID=45607 RepID=A0A2T0FJJ2_9ASCO|nr:hypothetical protein B9G98_02780 [Wickerhamiella sorbophila]PRT55160.1 hypothetical protein B9G98_02780 [Wickerhamiella sorbophila]
MPKLLSCSPKDTDFIGIKEYLASTPVDYALEDSPVLYVVSDGNMSGLASGPARLWVASNGLHFWPAAGGRQGFTVDLDEVNLHAIQTEPPALYLQVQGEQDYDFSDLKFAAQVPVSRLYEAVSACIETFTPTKAAAEDHQLSGADVNVPLPDLKSGQADDEVYYTYNYEGAAAADVDVGGEGRLGKSRRRSDSMESERTRKQPRD